MTSIWFAQQWQIAKGDPSTLLAPATYYGAGQDFTSTREFTFHQIVSYKNAVYDPSTGDKLTDPATGQNMFVPRQATSFNAYLDLFAPDVYTGNPPQRKYPIQQTVTSI